MTFLNIKEIDEKMNVSFLRETIVESRQDLDICSDSIFLTSVIIFDGMLYLQLGTLYNVYYSLI